MFIHQKVKQKSQQGRQGRVLPPYICAFASTEAVPNQIDNQKLILMQPAASYPPGYISIEHPRPPVGFGISLGTCKIIIIPYYPVCQVNNSPHPAEPVKDQTQTALDSPGSVANMCVGYPRSPGPGITARTCPGRSAANYRPDKDKDKACPFYPCLG